MTIINVHFRVTLVFNATGTSSEIFPGKSTSHLNRLLQAKKFEKFSETITWNNPENISKIGSCFV